MDKKVNGAQECHSENVKEDMSEGVFPRYTMAIV